LTVRQRSRVCRAVVVLVPALLLCTSAACPGELHLPFSRYRLPDVSEVDDAGDGTESPRELAAEEKEYGSSERGKKIAGAVMFGSGVLLCSWGIVDWHTDDTQCCPAKNTENVAKIVVGVVLINAGLVYLIAGGL
jgi:hypothetical protein